MTLDSLPDLEYKRVVSCKDSFHGTDVLAVPEHGAPGRRPNIHAHFVGRQRDGLDTTAGPRRRGKPKHSHRGHPVPGPGNVAAKRAGSVSRPSSVLDDKQVNAFCLPGGKVAVYTGILPLTRDDAQLASVLPREL